MEFIVGLNTYKQWKELFIGYELDVSVQDADTKWESKKANQRITVAASEAWISTHLDQKTT